MSLTSKILAGAATIALAFPLSVAAETPPTSGDEPVTETAPAPAAQSGPHADGTHKATPVPVDTNGDGKADAWDRNGDGKPDAWDTNGDGAPDAWDEDGDGTPELKDADGDGRPDPSQP